MASYSRALSFVTIGSLAVPIIGLASAPILAHSLGADGRGAVGAAIAPNLLIVGGATLGLPAAVTYLVSKNPVRLWSVAVAASFLSLPIAIVCFATVALVSDVLSAGDTSLGQLMTVGAALAVPTLGVGILRGAAMAREMWVAVSLERLVSSIIRLLWLLILLLFNSLSVGSAFLSMAVSPIIAGLVYYRLLQSVNPAPPSVPKVRSALPELFKFGSKVWVGSVATVLFARSTDLFMTPLGGTEQLGIFLVAVTISDIPYILSQAVYSVLYSTSSASMDVDRIARTTRCCLILSFLGSVVLGATLPLWLQFAFGPEFSASLVPTWLLLAAATVAVPGMVVGAGIDASGRPGTRSVILLSGVALNISLLMVLVPFLGAVGASVAGLVSMVTVSTLSVVMVSRILKAHPAAFVVPRWTDCVDLTSRSARFAARSLNARRAKPD